MCDYTPGKVLVLGKKYMLSDMKATGQDLPGTWSLEPLLTGLPEDAGETALANLGLGVLRTEPGLELHAMSLLSAQFAQFIKKGEVVVDLDHHLPMGADNAASPVDVPFSPHALSVLETTRKVMSEARGFKDPRTVAVLDSGLHPDLYLDRPYSYADYSNRGQWRPNMTPQDPRGHGTRVIRILDQLLPRTVSIAIGRLPAAGEELTMETVARAFADLVVRSRPHVVNLSLAIRGDMFRCKHCGRLSGRPGNFTPMLSLVARLANDNVNKTVTVVAAGNSGQIAASRWLISDKEPMLIAVAADRSGQKAGYSSAPAGLDSEAISVRAFGGDGDVPGGQGMFTDGQSGTSFAAPIITAQVLAARAAATSLPPNATTPPLADQVADLSDWIARCNGATMHDRIELLRLLYQMRAAADEEKKDEEASASQSKKKKSLP
jgi:hypothetical protein